MEEKKKVFCITIGINETRVLKELSSHNFKEYNGWVSYDYLFNHFQDNPSIRHHSTLGECLYRLKRKNLVEYDEKSIRITQKGILLLEVIKKEEIINEEDWTEFSWKI